MKKHIKVNQQQNKSHKKHKEIQTTKQNKEIKTQKKLSKQALIKKNYFSKYAKLKRIVVYSIVLTEFGKLVIFLSYKSFIKIIKI